MVDSDIARSSPSIKAIPTLYRGISFRSRTEARWAVFFDAIPLAWEYEAEGFDLPCGKYLPDFWLPEINFWFEVKGARATADEIVKAGFLYSCSGKKVLIAVGSPAPKAQLLQIPLLLTPEESESSSGSTEPRFYFCDDRRNEDELWLTDDDCSVCWWIGPKSGPNHGRWPLVHSATKRAYEGARTATFWNPK